MTNREDLPKTVAVPTELLKDLIEIVSFYKGSTPAGRQATALLPKPKPRLVAVTPEEWHGDFRLLDQRWLDAQPDLLTLLDEAVDGIPTFGSESRGLVKSRIRAALGVTE